MKLAIIYNTHVTMVDEIPVVIKKILTKIDIIVHAGDFTQKAVFDGLRSMGKVRVVQANMDSTDLKRTCLKRFMGS